MTDGRKPIFLLGFPGCGKTTVCNALSTLYGDTYKFIDLDDFIVERIGMSISNYFHINGEAAFRTLETDCLMSFSNKRDTVIACGGGTPCFGNNMDVMNSLGDTVWLKTSEDKLFIRLAAGREQRPLIADKNDEQLKEYISSTLKARSVFYSKAKLTFSTENLDSKDEIDAAINHLIDVLAL